MVSPNKFEVYELTRESQQFHTNAFLFYQSALQAWNKIPCETAERYAWCRTWVNFAIWKWLGRQSV